jgi:hypothetical protein
VFTQRFIVPIVTAAGGGGVGYTPGFSGVILAIIYQKTDYSNNVTLSAALESTGEVVLALAAGAMDSAGTWYPRKPVQKAADGSAVGTYNVEPVAAANDRLVLTIAAGGNTHSGTFIVVVG